MADTRYLVKYRLCAFSNSSRPEVKAFTDKKKALEFYKRLRFEAHAQYKTVTFVEETTYKTEELKEMLQTTTDKELRDRSYEIDRSYKIEKYCHNCKHCHLTRVSIRCNLTEESKEVEICGTCDLWEGK